MFRATLQTAFLVGLALAITATSLAIDITQCTRTTEGNLRITWTSEPSKDVRRHV